MMSITNICHPTEIPPDREIAYCDEDHTTDAKTQEVAQILIQNQSEKRPIRWTRWTSEEKSRLLKLVKKHGAQWTLISAKMHRTNNACRAMFQDLSKQKTDTKPVKKQKLRVKKEKWTSDEKLNLLRLVDAHKEHDWSKIASLLKNKTIIACQVMFSRLNKKREVEALKGRKHKSDRLEEPGSEGLQAQLIAQKTLQEQPVKKTIIKREWSSKKQSKLIRLANQYKNDWKKIAPMLNKSAGACQAKFSRLNSVVALLSLKNAS